MKKTLLVYITILCPLFSFSQRKVEDFFNNKIDFVLDNDYGKSFMGCIVAKYIKTDSLNHFYNKTNIQPFYKYIESKYFDQKFLNKGAEIYNENEVRGIFIFENSKKKIHYFYNLDLANDKNFSIESHVQLDINPRGTRKAYYKPFKNFELSSNINSSDTKKSVKKTLYSNVSLNVYGISLFDKESIAEISFFNTLTIDYTNYSKCINFKNKDECLSFSVSIHETVNLDGSYVEEDKNHIKHHYLGSYPNVIMRKVEITGNKEEAIKYLKQCKLDYIELKAESYKEEFFERK